MSEPAPPEGTSTAPVEPLDPPAEPKVTDPPESPQLSSAAALWEAGDIRGTRTALDALDPSALSPSDQLHYTRLTTGTTLDPVHLWVGAALFVIWATLAIAVQ